MGAHDVSHPAFWLVVVGVIASVVLEKRHTSRVREQCAERWPEVERARQAYAPTTLAGISAGLVAYFVLRSLGYGIAGLAICTVMAVGSGVFYSVREHRALQQQGVTGYGHYVARAAWKLVLWLGVWSYLTRP
jgi:hypothetical protein